MYLINNMGLNESVDLKKYRSGEELIFAYESGARFSVILLDMQMNELDGIQTANVIRQMDKDCLIIIVTSIIEYAVEGYSIDAYDFVLKPIDQEKFYRVLRKAIKEIQVRANKIYEIRTRDMTKMIRLAEITYFESNRKKVIVHTIDGHYENNESISTVEDKLTQDGFVRISRYYLINVNYIKEIDVKTLVLLSGEELKYSDKYRDKIKSEYMKFMVGEIE